MPRPTRTPCRRRWWAGSSSAPGAFVLLFTGTLTLLTAMTARDLMRHRRRVFCMIVAGIHCINFPLGMALGIFTIILLSKPEAKTLFEQGRPEG
ncbi:hypothetical protein OT109_16500 [Phycisphaeraceae bacterium D3-23]